MENKYYTESGAEVNFVKKARKDNSVAKKGESYYWVKTHKFSQAEYYKEIPGKYKKNVLTKYIRENYFSKQHLKEALILLAKIL